MTSVFIFGCGYVGTALAEAFLARGVTVGALTRNPEKAAALRAMGVSEVVEGDLHSSDWHGRVQGDYSHVVNCVSSAGGGIEGYRLSYFEGQRSILKWSAGRKIERYIYTSSTSVYPQDGGVWVDETADTSAAPETGQVLCESEQLLLQSEAVQQAYVLRLAGIYGPGRHYLLDLLKAGETRIAGRGDYHLNLIHRDDIVSAMLRILESDPAGPAGIYNLADDQPATKEALVQWLSEQLNVESPVFDPDYVSPRVRRRGGRMPDRRIANEKFKESFGWSPQHKDFQAGYQSLIEIFVADNKKYRSIK